MSLTDCLEALQGYGVTLQRRGGGLVVKSASFATIEKQKATLQAYKPLLLALLPEDGAGFSPGAMLEAVGVYWEHCAIMEESDVTPDTVKAVALEQVRRVLYSG